MFMDGSFFLKVNTYYKYNHPRRSNISFNGLAEFIKDEVSRQEQVDKRYCHIVEAHWFRGRFSTNQLQHKFPDDAKRLNFITNERNVDDMFMYEGIVQHVYPLQVNPTTGSATEKGIDVWLSLEAFELAVLKRFDVLALIAGDTDYVPLIRKINGLGTRVMVLGWDFEYTDNNGNRNVTRTGQALIDECSYPIMMEKVIDDKSNKNDAVVNGIFAH